MSFSVDELRNSTEIAETKINPLGVRRLDVDRIIELLVKTRLDNRPSLFDLITAIVDRENFKRRIAAEIEQRKFIPVEQISFKGGEANWDPSANEGFKYCAYNVGSQGRPKIDQAQKQLGAQKLPLQTYNNILIFLYRDSSQDIFALTKKRTWEMLTSYTDYEWPRQFCRNFLDPNRVLQVSRESIFGVARKEELSFSGFQRIDLLEKRDRLYTMLVLTTRSDEELFPKEVLVTVRIGQIRIHNQRSLQDYSHILEAAAQKRTQPRTQMQQKRFELLDYLKKVNDKDLQKQLCEHILNLLEEAITESKRTTFSLYHKFLIENLLSDSSSMNILYKKRKNELPLFSTLENVLSVLRTVLPAENLREELSKVKISFGNSKKHPLMDFIEGEIRVGDLVYFRINKCFYQLSGDYLSIIQVDFRQSLKELLIKNEEEEGTLQEVWGGQTRHGHVTERELKKVTVETFESFTKKEVRYIDPEKSRNNVLYSELKGEILQNPEIASKRKEIDEILKKNKTLSKKTLAASLKTTDSFADRIWRELIKKRPLLKKEKNKWYVLNPLINNKEIENFLDPLCFQYYAHETEGSYNERYLNKPGYIVGDCITPFGIEIFDILQFNEKTTYVYHVKEGFDLHVRDALDQLINSVEMIYEACYSDSEKNVLDAWYELATSTEDAKNEDLKYREQLAKQMKKMSLQEFKELFTNRKLVFVYAVLDSADEERTLEREIELKESFCTEDFEGMIKGNHKTQVVSNDIFRMLQSEKYLDTKGRLTSKFYSISKERFSANFSLGFERDGAAKKRIYDQLKKGASQFNSTIALLALRRLRKQIKGFNYDFKIFQIKRAQYQKGEFSPPVQQFSSIAELPPLTKGVKVFNSNEKKYVRKHETQGDGSCALHALNGALVKGVWTFNPQNKMKNLAQRAKYDFLQKIDEIEVKPQVFFDSLFDYVNESETLKQQYEKTLVLVEAEEKQARQKKIDFYKELLNQEPYFTEIFPILQSSNSKYKNRNKDWLKSSLLASKKDLLNAFSNNLAEIEPKIKNHKDFKEVFNRERSVQKMRENEKRKFLSKKEIWNDFKQHILVEEYQLTDNELELAACVYDKKVTLFTGPLSRTLNSEGKIEVAIEHEGNHQFGHYSRLEETE